MEKKEESAPPKEDPEVPAESKPELSDVDLKQVSLSKSLNVASWKKTKRTTTRLKKKRANSKKRCSNKVSARTAS